jgi:hypothetical protein
MKPAFEAILQTIPCVILNFLIEVSRGEKGDRLKREDNIPCSSSVSPRNPESLKTLIPEILGDNPHKKKEVINDEKMCAL